MRTWGCANPTWVELSTDVPCRSTLKQKASFFCCFFLSAEPLLQLPPNKLNLLALVTTLVDHQQQAKAIWAVYYVLR